MIKKTIQFFKDVRLELSKVAYPTRQELFGSTIVVMVMVIIMSAFIGVVDLGLSQLVQLVLR
ncbi:MAG: preprotein translocase subunit SecE [candidate division Zixibacteria bacterium]|nr:preprotein translocase subunit SecE [candidate division Zixibacteria bacterium]